MDVRCKGTVRNGVVVLPPEAKLPEGSAVEVIPQDARATERMARCGTRPSDRQRALDSLYAVFSERRAPGWDVKGFTHSTAHFLASRFQRTKGG
jgi:hypothetical protein